MRLTVLLGVIIVVAVLLTSSAYVIFFMEEDDGNNDDNINGGDDTGNGEGDDNGDDDDQNGGNNGNNNSNGNGDEEITHYVFIEESTATTCRYCPAVADILHELYTSGTYQFYYVSMVWNQNTIAEDRVKNEYNLYADPTVFIDGGYNVILGGTHPMENYSQAIQEVGYF